MSERGKAKYSTSEEIANSITHGIGIVLAVAGLGVLTAFAGRLGSARHVVGCSIYAATMILLFTASSLYHAIPLPRAKSVLRVLDHSAIYLLIAGTYTPFTLVNLRGPWGWTLFGVVWGMALIGILLEVLPGGRRTGISLALYVIMGWCVVAAGRPLLATVAPGGLLLFHLPSRRKGFTARLLPPRLHSLISAAAWRLLHPGRPWIEMHGIPSEEVTAWLESSGGRVLDVQARHSAGDGWETFRYAVTR